MNLALFDLDHTLLDGDSNSLWLGYLDIHGLLPAGALERQAEEYARYEAGTLDIEAYLRFQLSLLVGRPVAEWSEWRRRFVAAVIVPRISAAARAAVARHRFGGDRLAIITATHGFLAGGVAGLLELDVIAPRAEVADGDFSGRVAGDICFGAGKRDCLRQWLAKDGLVPEDFALVHFYSDSINDLPLLESVTHPVVVNADAALAEVAAARGWPRETWRSGIA